MCNKEKRWHEASKVKLEEGLQCAHNGCHERHLAILDGPNEPGVICFQHYVHGEQCTNGCDRPQIDSGLCRQCLLGEEEPIEISLYPESTLARCPEVCYAPSDLLIKEIDLLLSRSMKKRKMFQKKFNPLLANQV